MSCKPYGPPYVGHRMWATVFGPSYVGHRKSMTNIFFNEVNSLLAHIFPILELLFGDLRVEFPVSSLLRKCPCSGHQNPFHNADLTSLFARKEATIQQDQRNMLGGCFVIEEHLAHHIHDVMPLKGVFHPACRVRITSWFAFVVAIFTGLLSE